ncbi:MAG: hypothetical protein ABSA31_01365 [Acidimicrobiales bacterium]|jgi:hypothetical protein
MAVEQQEKKRVWIPPYIAWRTLNDLILRMEKEEPPARIDKSYLDTFSGGYQTQVLAALDALGLRNKKTAEVEERMHELVRAADTERRALVAAILREHYGAVLALGKNATQQQMVDAFREMGVSGTDTMRKVISFFLAAAKYSGVPVSKLWKTPAVRPAGQKRDKTLRGPSDQRGVGPGDGGDSGEEPKQSTRSLELESGAIVTLAVSADLFSLTGQDREFVFGLIDTMNSYSSPKRAQLPAAGGSGRTPDEGAEKTEVFAS